MKLADWLNILKDSSHWLLILCVTNVFFIFFAWLAYPEAFQILVNIMIVYSFVTIVLGMIIHFRRQKKQERIFYKFIREPSKENEKELLQTSGELHKEKVNTLGNRLRNLKDELDQAKIQTTDYREFIESWVHEIKAPISLITLVLENRKDEMSELVYQRMEYARINVLDHVERILFYARLQGTHVDYHLERISLINCLEEALFELQGLLDEKEIKVISQIEDLPIMSDKKALHFIFTQVFINAIKYCKEEMDRCIWIKTGLDRTQDRYYVQIRDNGIGVLKSDLPFIFDKGFTGDNLHQKQSTGIGLYLVKKLCDQLNIEIVVDSEYGKGFEIQLLFPKVVIL